MTLTISIVSYNNNNYLLPCLKSIYDNCKSVDYEIIVVAYMFSKENLSILKNKYTSIKIIESNDIRGFSENHNMAIREAKGEYVLILNDDTYFDDDSIGKLVVTISSNRNIAVVNPLIFWPDGNIQYNGRTSKGLTLFSYIAWELRIRLKDKNVNQHIYSSYNISGACFLIRRIIFNEFNNFDEDYFFCPEDADLSKKLSKSKYSVITNSEARVYHHFSATANKFLIIITTVTKQGIYLYFRKNYGYLYEGIVRIFTFIIAILKFLILSFQKRDDKVKNNIKASLYTLKYSFSGIHPKELFVLLLNKFNLNIKK